MQDQVIGRMHEQGHFSTVKREDLVRASYWIPNLRPKVEKAVRHCFTCILAERTREKQECPLNPIEKESIPIDTLHIDHLEPLPSTTKSYNYVLVVIDAFSKFTWLYGTKSTGTTEVLTQLSKHEEASTIFCNPRRIISDRGTVFTSQEFEDYCKVEGIKH